MATPKPEIFKAQLRQTTCPYCGVGCGVDVSCNVSERTTSLDKVTGTPEHPANYGRLCVKGTNLLETNDLSGRLLHPTIAGAKVDWDTATRAVADKISQTIAEHGSDAVAFYVSGQLLTEDYYVANKLMKGFIGSANIDTNSRLCMSSAVAGYKRAFGEDVVPCDYTDLECTSLLVLTGSNTAWAHPVLFQRIQRAKLRNPDMKVVVIDPRETETCTIADLHLPLKGGSDVALFNGLLQFAHANNAIDAASIGEFTQGLDDALATANTIDSKDIAGLCGLNEADLATFYQWFINAESAVTFYSMGVNQSSAGVDKANAIINCHLALDFIGKPGCGPFSITGQPNAMGGREVGGLANMLAAHCDIENPKHRENVKAFWQSPSIPEQGGLKAVDLFSAMDAGRIKFVWIMGTNPVVSMPYREQVESALKKCDMVVVSDIVQSNDTLAFADIALPATGWSEKDGTVTNSERRISRQRGIMPPPGEAKHDWQIMCDVARKMGFNSAFSYSHPSEIFDEHARLTAYKNDGARLLNLAPLTGKSEAEYNVMAPVTWPLKADTNKTCSPVRPYYNKVFSTPSGKANFVAVTFNAPIQATSNEYPFVLNSGRMRDQWHTMTRTGKAAILHAHATHANVHIHPEDATKLGVMQNDYVALSSKVSGETPCVFPVHVDKRQRQGDVFVPIHWSGEWGSHSKLAKLYAPVTDPISGQPELKHGAVSIVPADFASYGNLYISDDCTAPSFVSPDGASANVTSYEVEKLTAIFDNTGDFWAKNLMDNGFSLSVASQFTPHVLMSRLLASLPKDWVCYQYKSADSHVLVGTYENAFCFMAFVGEQNPSTQPKYCVPNGWVDSTLKQAFDPETLASFLRCEVDESFLNGQVICSCFTVREKTINQAIAEGCSSVTALGDKLKCGTNCGSCKPALATLLNDYIAPIEDIARER
ncbi:nitrate reductase [Alteromonas sp. 1_MG-2023]|uniref:nitrate reductase n=1 Tax=Alteromonas sp. 1_MG-2023 TaxID=3062669 RepID=UPI0026E35035|nr:nitrate reductase [Alteromonas sp. 1_MG-2023]MDO6565728.1 nitrate reductase [Alteromonas sp. 1_MG-2023]